MSDLISRQALIDSLEKDTELLGMLITSDFHDELLDNLIPFIEEQPTAYDLDKVVEQIVGCDGCNGCCICYEEERMMDCEEYARVYEIVKAGGVE